MSFEATNTTRREEAAIPNTQLESMFMRVSKDEEMQEYMKLINQGYISLATAYASDKVYRLFYPLVEEAEKKYGTIDVFKEIVVKGKGK